MGKPSWEQSFCSGLGWLFPKDVLVPRFIWKMHPSKWSFNSLTFLKSGEQAPRTPVFAEDILVGETGEGEGVKPPEKSFWAKYWMYLIPLGLIVMNAITQAMNMAEEQVSGQAAGQAQPQQSAAAVQRGPGSSAVRRR
ncbi:ER membrane protein complex subunit 10 [Cucumis melo var. makuwa]|uniref:ER membrane protein complex subunit 10 n=1 Tax=Cucumis melo var. makuwa TaxID=1194695 RepID=A0A5A7T9U1_CUCMM|nr:ER membrane protein complex subunit 10 [Cucumis melo var. makuwa]